MNGKKVITILLSISLLGVIAYFGIAYGLLWYIFNG
ncbi:hypothetical protein M2109_000807 [Paenibacillus sp. PastH-3]|nr:hypothetical protein [Paenibacillus sp. PastH-4]MDH6442794.1 hypothetical protein [Paenibacillus sp. PastF-4]MDH6526496.1 hypothetical protein [Paenibacillus sp. PastH-3]